MASRVEVKSLWLAPTMEGPEKEAAGGWSVRWVLAACTTCVGISVGLVVNTVVIANGTIATAETVVAGG